MTRPIYEVETDRDAELAVAQLIAVKYGVVVQPAEKLAAFDWVVLKNERVGGLLEIKCRSHARAKYPSLLLSKRKWDTGIRMAKEADTPFYIAASFNGEVCWINACQLEKDVAVANGGRTDRNDPDDEEVCVMIPVKSMVPVWL